MIHPSGGYLAMSQSAILAPAEAGGRPSVAGAHGS